MTSATIDTECAEGPGTSHQTRDTPWRALSSDAIKLAEEQGVLADAAASGKPDHEVASVKEPASLGDAGFGSTDEHSGSYSYRIPVHVPPPNNGGPSPEVSLVYNSLAAGSKSLAGTGWRLDWGRIERRPRRRNKVNFKNDQGSEKARDHFVLQFNGQSYTLVNVYQHPHLFRAKIEGAYAEVRRVLSSEIDPHPDSGDPEIDFWEMTLADGTRCRFGVPGAAGNQEVGGELRNKVWNIFSIENTYGQKVLYEYTAHKNESNPSWKEMAYTYPARIKCGVTRDQSEYDSVIDFVYADETPPDDRTGYGNLGIAYTGRERNDLTGWTCILWKRLTEIRTSFRNGDGDFVPACSLVIEAEHDPQSNLVYVNQVSEIAYQDGHVDETATLPPHRFTYDKGEHQSAGLMRRAVAPLGKSEELKYGSAAQLDQGDPQEVQDMYLVETYTERAGAETWTKEFSYWDGYRYAQFDEYRGHSRVDVTDQETGLRTDTRFEQNGVHNGYTKQQTSYDANGKRIAHTENRWMALDYHGGRYMPFIQKSVERRYAEDGVTLLSTKVTEIPKRPGRESPEEYELDQYGNVLRSIETVYDGRGSLVLETETETKWKNVDERAVRLIGLPVDVKKSARNSRDDGFQLIEWIEREYNDKGQIVASTRHVDGHRPERALKQATEYDATTGKPTKRYRYNEGKKQLHEETRYFEDGPFRFLVREILNAKGQTVVHLAYDLQARKPTRIVGFDEMEVQRRYDGLGRVTEELYVGHVNRATRDAAKASLRYEYTVTPETRQIETLVVHTGGRTIERFDELNRKYEVCESGYGGRLVVRSHTEFDHRTRQPGRVAEPHYQDEPAPSYLVTEYDDPRLRKTKEMHPSCKVLRFRYDGLRTTILEEVYDLGRDGQPGDRLFTRVVEQSTNDALGRVIQQAEGQPDTPTRYELFHEYDVQGRNVKSVDSRGVTLSKMEFGDRMDDKPVAITDVSRGASAMTYDDLGRLAETRRDFKGDLDCISTFKYDDLDRVVYELHEDTVGAGSRRIEQEYDTAPHGVGELALQTVTETNDLGTCSHRQSYAYDEFGLQSKIVRHWEIKWPALGIERACELCTDCDRNGLKSGRLERLVFPSVDGLPRAVCEYRYDDATELIREVSVDAIPAWRVTAEPGYTARSQVAQFTLGNSVVTTNGYNHATGLLDSVTTQRESAQLFEQRLSYDASDNLRQQTITTVMPHHADGETPLTLAGTYTYDDKHQLCSAEENDVRQMFTYGPSGSRIAIAVSGPPSRFAYDATSPDRVTSISGGMMRQFSFDRSGHLTVDVRQDSQRMMQIVWNPSGRVQQLHAKNSEGRSIRRVCYAYDANGARVAMYDSLAGSLTLYAGDDFEVNWKTAGGRPLARAHISQSGHRLATLERRAEDSACLTYYHRDRLGSVVMTTNERADVLCAAVYGPYGQVTNGSGYQSLDLLFTGHRNAILEDDGFGYLDCKARLYMPELGLFASPDERENATDIGFGRNPYIYCNNNPLLFVDPTGLGGKKWSEIIKRVARFLDNKKVYLGNKSLKNINKIKSLSKAARDSAIEANKLRGDQRSGWETAGEIAINMFIPGVEQMRDVYHGKFANDFSARVGHITGGVVRDTIGAPLGLTEELAAIAERKLWSRAMQEFEGGDRALALVYGTGGMLSASAKYWSKTAGDALETASGTAYKYAAKGLEAACVAASESPRTLTQPDERTRTPDYNEYGGMMGGKLITPWYMEY